MAGRRAIAREPKEIVARGYDAIALRYAEWAGRVDSPTMQWVRDLDRRLDPAADVLELGCGRGVPATRELARRHRVSGVDISAVQIELARHHVPEASFIHADAMELEVAPSSFDAIAALFVFGHVPIEEQPGLINRSWVDVARYRDDAKKLGYDDDALDGLVVRWNALVERAKDPSRLRPD